MNRLLAYLLFLAAPALAGDYITLGTIHPDGSGLSWRKQGDFYAAEWGTPAAGNWTPSNATVEVRLWLDGADSDRVQLAGSVVSNWLDKSGNALNFVQATDSYRPTYNSAGLDGKGTIEFDGVDNRLGTPDAAAVQFGTNDFACYFVGMTTSTNDEDGTFVSKNYNGFESYRLRDNFGGYMAGASKNAWYSGALVENEYAVLAHLRTGSVNMVWVNGVCGTISPTNTGSVSKSGTGLYLGARAGTANWLEGGIAEIVILYGTISQADMQRMEGYLAHKWGLEANLPAEHPYKSAAPTTD